MTARRGTTWARRAGAPFRLIAAFAAGLRGAARIETFRAQLPPAAAARAAAARRREDARRGLAIIGATVELRGSLSAEGPYLVVANHLGYVDVLALAALLPVRFVAKSEVARWPVVGRLARAWDTVFVERGRAAAAPAMVAAVAAGLRRGESIAVFPEGTSTDGAEVLPFKSGVFATVEGNDPPASILPVRIEIAEVDGETPDAAARASVAWFGDDALVGHILRFASRRSIGLRITIGEPIVAAGRPRKELAAAAHAAVERLAAEHPRAISG